MDYGGYNFSGRRIPPQCPVKDFEHGAVDTVLKSPVRLLRLAEVFDRAVCHYPVEFTRKVAADGHIIHEADIQALLSAYCDLPRRYRDACRMRAAFLRTPEQAAGTAADIKQAKSRGDAELIQQIVMLPTLRVVIRG
jgi:hypothetical protein